MQTPKTTPANGRAESQPIVQPWQMRQSDFIAKHKAIDAAWQEDKAKPSTATFGTFYGYDYQAYQDQDKGYGYDKPGAFTGTYEQHKHHSEVRNALANGRNVPEDVLNDYPDLVEAFKLHKTTPPVNAILTAENVNKLLPIIRQDEAQNAMPENAGLPTI